MESSPQAFASLKGLAGAMFARVGQMIAPARELPRQVLPAVAQEDNPFQDRPRVLVVDDLAEHRLRLEAMLYRWSIAPVQAADGAEAVALACGQHFDLILMDLQMPILDGLSATAQIRDFERRNEHPRAPIIAHSSLTLEDDWPILRACGFDESLVKPCSSGLLGACLQRWCGARLSDAARR